jgi:protein phosphatase methylesterase 1
MILRRQPRRQAQSFLLQARTSSKDRKGESATISIRLTRCAPNLTGHRSVGWRSRSAPLPWTQFFMQELYFDHQADDVKIRHHAYLSPPTGSGPLFVTHHGAGSSGLSFATFTSEIQKVLPNAGVLSLDARGHGETTVDSFPDDSLPVELDLSLATLSRDLVFIVQSTLPRLPQSSPPPIILIGHSLGGAVITHVAYSQLLGSSLLGHVVLDVVEGSAIDALQSMEIYLSTRPKAFSSLSSGIEWHTRSRTIRNTTSARVSVPSLLKGFDDDGTTLWTWKTDLAATKPFWENWFIGLSKKFLEAQGGKLLILAGTDRLDKELMIGQMQGRPHPAFPPTASKQFEMSTDYVCRQIPTPSLPRSRPLCPRRPTSKDSPDRHGFLSTK